MKKVLIPTKLDLVAQEMLTRHGGYEVIQEEGTDLLALAASHPDTYALIVRSEKVTAGVMEAFPGLKVIIRAGAGYNTIDTLHARKNGIDVMNTPGANSNAVAEEAVAMMLADARHLIAADASCRAGKWDKSSFMGRELAGKTLGIVGLGFIGRLLVKRLQGFEMNVVAYDPLVSPEKAQDLGVAMVSMAEVFTRADYVSLHIPENEDTRGIINKDYLSLMKPGASVINCARAGIVNEEDLRAVKAEKGLRFLNDVYPKDDAGAKSVADIADIMLPHLGASTREANANAARLAAQELIEFDDKGITSYIVNRDIPEGLDEAYGDLAYTLTRLCRVLAGEQHQLQKVETSIYGDLKPFADWLLVPVVTALHKDFDRSIDHKAALNFLADLGVEYTRRETDERKGYHNSITVDLITCVNGGTLRRTSVRGTVAEGIIMIARINDFDQLYFDPRGHIAAFSYKDRPGVLGRMAAALAESQINIDDVRNPHDSKGEHSIAVFKVNKQVPAEVIGRIRDAIEADIACSCSL